GVQLVAWARCERSPRFIEDGTPPAYRPLAATNLTRPVSIDDRCPCPNSPKTACGKRETLRDAQAARSPPRCGDRMEGASVAQRAHVRTPHRPGRRITRRESAVERSSSRRSHSAVDSSRSGAWLLGCGASLALPSPRECFLVDVLCISELHHGRRAPHVFALPASHADFQHTSPVPRAGWEQASPSRRVQ